MDALPRSPGVLAVKKPRAKPALIDQLPTLAVARTCGRPTDYRPEYCELVLELAGRGWSKAEMAAYIGVARFSLLRWRETHPEFDEAMEIATDICLAWWESRGRQGMTERGFNAAIWSRSMSARFPADYREERNTNVNFKDATPREIRQLTDRELEVLADESGAGASGAGGSEAGAGETAGSADEPAPVR